MIWLLLLVVAVVALLYAINRWAKPKCEHMCDGCYKSCDYTTPVSGDWWLCDRCMNIRFGTNNK